MIQCLHHPSRTGVPVEQGHVSVYTVVGVFDELNIWSDTFALVSQLHGDPAASDANPVNQIPRRSHLYASVGQHLLEEIY
jgi:hypothetical protein